MSGVFKMADYFIKRGFKLLKGKLTLEPIFKSCPFLQTHIKFQELLWLLLEVLLHIFGATWFLSYLCVSFYDSSTVL